MKVPFARLVLLMATLFVLMAPGMAAAQELAVGNPQLLQFTLPAASRVVSPTMPVANWIHLGCWTPRSGSPCVDIYRDGSGQLWRCKACGSTGNPSPGKCTKTSQTELDRGLWCS